MKKYYLDFKFPHIPAEFTNVESQNLPPMPHMYPPYPNYQTPYFVPHPQYPVYQDIPQESSPYRSQKFFRPWEDSGEEASHKPVTTNPVKFDEADFPSLETGLSKMNIK